VKAGEQQKLAAHQAVGWARVDPRPWSKITARWEHPSGWQIQHCGHPTAHHPWMLYSPEGAFVRTGAVRGARDVGGPWSSLIEPMDYVATQIKAPNPPAPIDDGAQRSFPWSASRARIDPRLHLRRQPLARALFEGCSPPSPGGSEAGGSAIVSRPGAFAGGSGTPDERCKRQRLRSTAPMPPTWRGR